ncbi:Qat anti-phage system associated protein QatB [Pseudomonas sp. TE3610]
MGTSKGYGGSVSGLVPSWVDDVAPATTSGQTNDPGQASSPSGDPNQPGQGGQPGQRPVDNSGTAKLQGARSQFTRFARTGSRSALGKALSSYVRSGTGGAGRAARRMGASRAAAGRLLGVIRDVQRFGAGEVLRRLNLNGLAGRPSSEVFMALVEFVCPAGGAIDEAVARQAMLESVIALAESEQTTFGEMTPEQMNEFFLDFVSQSIEGMVMADLGQRGITIPDDVNAVGDMQTELHDFITGATRGRLSDRLEGLPGLTDQDIQGVINRIYESAFEIIAVAAEAAQ